MELSKHCSIHVKGIPLCACYVILKYNCTAHSNITINVLEGFCIISRQHTLKEKLEMKLKLEYIVRSASCEANWTLEGQPRQTFDFIAALTYLDDIRVFLLLYILLFLKSGGRYLRFNTKVQQIVCSYF